MFGQQLARVKVVQRRDEQAFGQIAFARANSPVAQLKGISIEGRPGPDFFP
jgi:hypothetical protein